MTIISENQDTPKVGKSGGGEERMGKVDLSNCEVKRSGGSPTLRKRLGGEE